ncbi:MAG: DNA sulfur modification protein DndB [Planctomycetes bacterium]|nr:DNA sulfur modification protein DndB [Planctomycetota bacterium]
MKAAFEYHFPAIRGVQAGREYYVSMCPLHLIPRIFLFNEEELLPELRAQRVLNKARLPELSRYILENPSNYIFSAITASIDGDVRFDAMGGDDGADRIGMLRVAMSAKFLINDGQHRRAAIEVALKENPELGRESIAVVFFLDVGLKRCQQMFADLNRHAIRATRSLGILYDHRDERSNIAKEVLKRTETFQEVVEYEPSTLSPKSRKLFTLSAIYTAVHALIHGVEKPTEEVAAFAIDFWDTIAKQFPEWEAVRLRRMPAGEVRAEFIHSHGIALHALARVGNHFLREDTKNWKKILTRVRGLDWSRHNAKLWEGRALSGGRVSKSGNHVALTTAAIKKHLGLPLSAEEQRAETAFQASGRTKKHDIERETTS